MGKSQQPVLEFDRVSFDYGAVPVLRDVSFSVEPDFIGSLANGRKDDLNQAGPGPVDSCPRQYSGVGYQTGPGSVSNRICAPGDGL